MEKINQEEYKFMWDQFQNGLISKEVWIKFCDKILVQMLEDSKDVLIRLKNR